MPGLNHLSPFIDHAARLALGSNLGPAVKAPRPNHWTAKELSSLSMTVLLLRRFGGKGLARWARCPCPSPSSLRLTGSAWTAGLHSAAVKGRCC